MVNCSNFSKPRGQLFGSMSLEAICYDGELGKLSILNQLLLPLQSVYEELKTVEDAWQAIRKMKVRGAPAIAIVGTLSVALELKRTTFSEEEGEGKKELEESVISMFEYLKTARPTAVNIAEAADRFTQLVSEYCNQNSDKYIASVREIQTVLIQQMEKMLPDDIETNRSIGHHGAEHITQNLGSTEKVSILTHCNTGSLATAAYGTALGVIRKLHEMGRLEHVYCTETRPYNQGARLTAYELVHEKIPGTLICDSMSALLMQQRKISAVVVGADRVVRNGDTANKIGTYQLAIIAKHHNVPFYVASPLSTIDFKLESGSEIMIEERPSDEMLCVGGKRVAAKGIGCWNPAFDVTPADLITGGIVTEKGVFSPHSLTDVMSKS